jgi:hypothetical protein
MLVPLHAAWQRMQVGEKAALSTPIFVDPGAVGFRVAVGVLHRPSKGGPDVLKALSDSRYYK